MTGTQESNAFRDSFDFAFGDVRGIRLWRPYSHTGSQASRLRSCFRSYVWDGGVQEMSCLTNDGYHEQGVRRRECRETHDHSFEGPESRECFRDHLDGLDPDCECGFYAYTAIEENPYLQQRAPWVEGVIQGFGRVVVGPYGFRCSRARILALVLPHRRGVWVTADNDHAERVDRDLHEYYGDRWHIPIFSTRAAMLREFPLTHPEGARPDDTDTDAEH